jgi:hypothetical protein
MTMSTPHADTYAFDRLMSCHEESTQALERAIASNCPTLRNRLREYREIVAFRRSAASTRLQQALRLAAHQLSDIGPVKAAALYSPGNLGTIARTVHGWIDADVASPGTAVSMEPAGSGVAPTPREASYGLRRIVDFARQVVDARDALDLDVAASYLVDAARELGTGLLIEVLLGQVVVRPAQG